VNNYFSNIVKVLLSRIAIQNNTLYILNCLLAEVFRDFVLQGYRASAERASILFFVLNDMGAIDPMYQFALDSYVDLFNLSIDKSTRSAKLEERISNLNDYHTFAVYR